MNRTAPPTCSNPTCSARVRIVLAAMALAMTACGGNSVAPVTTPVVSSNNPVPAVTSVSPASVLAGAPATTLTVTGTNFVSNAVVQLGSAQLATTYGSATSLTAQVPASLLATAGAEAIAVANPAPGGGASAGVAFTIDNPPPTVTQASPASVLVGAQDTTITLTGTGFVASSTVQLGSTALVTKLESATALGVIVPAADATSAGSFSITVMNPSPGGGTSTPVSFAVDNPVPALNTISPTALAAASSDTELTLTGVNFGAGTLVRLNGVTAASTLVSATKMTVTVPASALAAAGTIQVAVFDPAPGGGSSDAQSLNVVAVGSLVLFAAPAVTANPAGNWNVSAAAMDTGGNPVPGLPVTLSAAAGAFLVAGGTTDAIGGYSTQYVPESSPSGSVLLQASTGSYTAAVAISFVDPRAPLPARKGSPRPAGASNPETLAAVGFAGGVGQGNALSTVESSTLACLNPFSMFKGQSAQCAAEIKQQQWSISIPNLLNGVCNVASALTQDAGILSCAGAVAVPIACATPETFVGGVICGFSIAIGASEIGMASACGEFLASLAAQWAAKRAAGDAGTIAESIGEFEINPSPSGALGVICSLLPPPPTPTASPCKAGQQCFFVANTDNTITVYDLAGNQLSNGAGIFPDLNSPDGMAYDDQTGTLFVANTGNGTVTAYDLAGNERPASPTFAFPLTVNGAEDVRYDATDDLLFVNAPENGQMLAFNATTGAPVTPDPGFANLGRPWGMLWSPSTNDLYISDASDGTVQAYKTNGTPDPLATPVVGLTSPDDFAIDTSSGTFYVSEAEGGSGTCDFSGIRAFDVNGNEVTPPGGYSTAACPDDMLVEPVTRNLYVVNVFGGVTVYDASGNDITSSAAPGGFPGTNQPAGIVLVTGPPVASGNSNHPPAGRSGSESRRGSTIHPKASGAVLPNQPGYAGPLPNLPWQSAKKLPGL